MIDDEVGKYRKKSTTKGQPRSKHKHIYIPVLLRIPYTVPEVKTGKDRLLEKQAPYNVCSICERVHSRIYDNEYYILEKHSSPFSYCNKILSETALNLPKYKLTDSFDKFAVKEEEDDG